MERFPQSIEFHWGRAIAGLDPAAGTARFSPAGAAGDAAGARASPGWVGNRFLSFSFWDPTACCLPMTEVQGLGRVLQGLGRILQGLQLVFASLPPCSAEVRGENSGGASTPPAHLPRGLGRDAAPLLACLRRTAPHRTRREGGGGIIRSPGGRGRRQQRNPGAAAGGRPGPEGRSPFVPSLLSLWPSLVHLCPPSLLFLWPSLLLGIYWYASWPGLVPMLAHWPASQGA